MNIIAAPEGIERVHREHPDVEIYCAAVLKSSTTTGILSRGWGMRAIGSWHKIVSDFEKPGVFTPVFLLDNTKIK
jgi:hypothetical protein